MESMATQILVIFIIRSRSFPGSSRAHPALVASSLAALALALLLPSTRIGVAFGFAEVPPALLLTLGVIVVVYLISAAALQFSGLTGPDRKDQGRDPSSLTQAKLPKWTPT
jgi:Mg2+-importing ATPase